MKKRLQIYNDCTGMTLVEVVVAAAVIAILSIGIFSSIVQGVYINNNTAQHTVAFGLCRERLEQMRGVGYASITTNVFSNETLPLTHLGGFTRTPLTCTLTNTITNLSSPTRKSISVQVEWSYKNRTSTEILYGIIYQKEADSNPLFRGDITGSININPNNSPDNEFVLSTPSGTISRDTLVQSYGGYSGPATAIRVKPKGNGNQNGLTLNGATYSLANCSTYTFQSSLMTVVVRNDKVKNGKATGKWWIDITATDTTIKTE
jgi:prepilin-type N-terminal cleavage/methylation domain-containing protein